MPCLYCGCDFDPETVETASPEVQVGVLLAKERYGDVGQVCAKCLASRGRLAMMYDCDFRR